MLRAAPFLSYSFSDINWKEKKYMTREFSLEKTRIIFIMVHFDAG
ncbi:hypothetical protein JMUB7495_27580 [Staphylococcus aureus]